MLYTPILALQLFCLYHAYSRRVDFWWYIIIFIVPFLGCVLYLYKHFNTPRTLDSIGNIAEEVKGTIDTSYKVRKLQKQLDFSDTAENKLKLGEEYLNQGFNDEAYELFKSCNKGVFENDPEVLAKLVQTSFLLHDYDATIEYGQQPNFQNDLQINNEKATLAWAYHHKNRTDDANLLFSTLDKSYGQYYMRHEFIKYLIATDQNKLADQKMSDLLEEISQMDRSERRLNIQDINAINVTAREI